MRPGRRANLPPQRAYRLHLIRHFDQGVQLSQVLRLLTSFREQHRHALFGFARLAVARKVRLRVFHRAQARVELEALAAHCQFSRPRREIEMVSQDLLSAAPQWVALALTRR